MNLILLIPAALGVYWGAILFFGTKPPDFFSKDPTYIFNKKAIQALFGNKERVVMKIFGIISWILSLVFILSTFLGWPIKV